MRIERVGVAGYPGLLIEEGLATRQNITVAEQHAVRERTELPDAIVALGVMPEIEAYRLLARAAGVDFISLEGRPSS